MPRFKLWQGFQHREPLCEGHEVLRSDLSKDIGGDFFDIWWNRMTAETISPGTPVQPNLEQLTHVEHDHCVPECQQKPWRLRRVGPGQPRGPEL